MNSISSRFFRRKGKNERQKNRNRKEDSMQKRQDKDRMNDINKEYKTILYLL